MFADIKGTRQLIRARRHSGRGHSGAGGMLFWHCQKKSTRCRAQSCHALFGHVRTKRSTTAAYTHLVQVCALSDICTCTWDILMRRTFIHTNQWLVHRLEFYWECCSSPNCSRHSPSPASTKGKQANEMQFKLDHCQLQSTLCLQDKQDSMAKMELC